MAHFLQQVKGRSEWLVKSVLFLHPLNLPLLYADLDQGASVKDRTPVAAGAERRSVQSNLEDRWTQLRQPLTSRGDKLHVRGLCTKPRALCAGLIGYLTINYNSWQGTRNLKKLDAMSQYCNPLRYSTRVQHAVSYRLCYTTVQYTALGVYCFA